MRVASAATLADVLDAAVRFVVELERARPSLRRYVLRDIAALLLVAADLEEDVTGLQNAATHLFSVSATRAAVPGLQLRAWEHQRATRAVSGQTTAASAGCAYRSRPEAPTGPERWFSSDDDHTDSDLSPRSGCGASGAPSDWVV